MTGLQKAIATLIGAPRHIARFVSRLQPRRTWYDTHLPLVPVPLRPERSALPEQRSMTGLGQGSSR